MSFRLYHELQGVGIQIAQAHQENRRFVYSYSTWYGTDVFLGPANNWDGPRSFGSLGRT